MDCSMPGSPVIHYLLEFAHTHVHWVGDAIQTSHSVAPFCSCLNLSQHQGLFRWVRSSHQVAKVLELQLQHQSFQWKFGLISFRIDWFDLLPVQGTLKSLFQHHHSKASILQEDNRMQCKVLILSFNNLRKPGFIQTPHYTQHNCRWRHLYCCLCTGIHRPVGKRGPLPVLRNINEDS